MLDAWVEQSGLNTQVVERWTWSRATSDAAPHSYHECESRGLFGMNLAEDLLAHHEFVASIHL